MLNILIFNVVFLHLKRAGPFTLNKSEDVIHEIFISSQMIKYNKTVMDTGIDLRDDWSSDSGTNTHNEAATTDRPAMLNTQFR